MRISKTTALALSFAFLGACSGGASEGGTGSNGSGTDGGAGNAGSGGGGGLDGGIDRGGSDASGSGGGGGASATLQLGAIALYSSRYTVAGTPLQFGTTSAYFYRYTPPAGGAPGGCTSQTIGTCAVSSCASVSAGDGGVALSYVSAGTIEVTGVTSSGGTMTLDPGGAGPYQGPSGAVAFWSGGESVRVRAPGAAGGAPAFDTTLTTPTTIEVTAPVFVQGRVGAPRATPLHVAWTGPSAGGVTVQLTGADSASSTIARCSFAPGAAGGDVPAAVLQAVDHGTTSILVSSATTARLTPGGWTIDVTLDSYGAQPNGLASGALDLQ